jgi:hypothetical protein
MTPGVAGGYSLVFTRPGKSPENFAADVVVAFHSFVTGVNVSGYLAPLYLHPYRRETEQGDSDMPRSHVWIAKNMASLCGEQENLSRQEPICA